MLNRDSFIVIVYLLVCSSYSAGMVLTRTITGIADCLHADRSDPSKQIHCVDHGGQISPLGVSQLDRKAPRYRTDELEAVHRGVVNIQYRPVCLGIRRVIASAGDAAKRLTPGNAVPDHHL